MSISFALSRKTKPLKLQKRTRTPGAVAPTVAKPFDANALLGQVAQRYFGSLQTPAQQQTLAKQSVDDQIKQAIAGINLANAGQVDAANRQAKRAQGFAEGLYSLSPNMASQIQSYYKDAANQIQNFGTGLTGAVGEAQQADAAKAQADVAQATGGQGVVGGYDVPSLRNIAQYTGVYTPAATLAGQGANEAAGEFGRNIANSQMIGNIAQQYTQNANVATTDKARQIAALEATRPGLINTALNAARGGNTQDMATLISALTLQGSLSQVPGKIASTAATTGLTKAKTGASKVGTKIATTKASGTTPAGKPAVGNYYVGKDPKTRIVGKIPPHSILDPNDPTYSHLLPDPYNPPPGQHYDPATGTFVVNPRTSTTVKGAKPASPSQVNSILNSATKNIARNIIGPPYTEIVPGSEYRPGGALYQPTGHFTTQQARQQLLRTYFPRALWKNLQAIGIVNDALAKAGYKV